MIPQHPAHIVLVEPRIPQNVGAVARLCAATRAPLHVIRPIPFSLSDRNLQRAGMDYLDLVQLTAHNRWAEFDAAPGRRWFLTSSGRRLLHQVEFRPGDALVFGSEEAGLPEAIMAEARDSHADIRIPMPEPRARCLNLATSVGIALYEMLRQTGGLIEPPRS